MTSTSTTDINYRGHIIGGLPIATGCFLLIPVAHQWTGVVRLHSWLCSMSRNNDLQQRMLPNGFLPFLYSDCLSSLAKTFLLVQYVHWCDRGIFIDKEDNGLASISYISSQTLCVRIRYASSLGWRLRLVEHTGSMTSTTVRSWKSILSVHASFHLLKGLSFD